MLPAPVNKYVQEKKPEAPKPKPKRVASKVPPYGKRENYIPRRIEDFGDGGAFPEIHIVQYPLDMGRSSMSGDSRVVTIATDENGVPDFQKNLINQGRSSALVIHSKVSSLVGKTVAGMIFLFS